MTSFLEDALRRAEEKIERGDFRKGLAKLEDACWNVTAADSVDVFDRIRALAEHVDGGSEGRLAKRAHALVALSDERRRAHEARAMSTVVVMPADQTSDGQRQGAAPGCLPVLAGTIAGAVIGAIVGAATEPPPDPNALVDLRGLQPFVYGFYGAIIGFSAIVVAGLLWRLLRQIERRRVRIAVVGAGICCIGLGLGIWGLTGGGSRAAGKRDAIPHGIFVCRNPFQAPEVFGGWQCPDETDIGTAPIRSPESLLCSTDLNGVAGKTIGIQVWYFSTLIRHASVHNTDAQTQAYVEFDNTYVNGFDTGLPPGDYRCRVFVNGKLLRSRSFAIGQTWIGLSRTRLRYHYVVRIATIGGEQRRSNTARLGEEFAVVLSSNDLPTNRAVRVELCVNHARGDACDPYYLVGRRPTAVDWEVDRGEGVGSLYRLSIRVRGHTVAHHDLRLVHRA
jgi:hypothetical protein